VLPVFSNPAPADGEDTWQCDQVGFCFGEACFKCKWSLLADYCDFTFSSVACCCEEKWICHQYPPGPYSCPVPMVVCREHGVCTFLY
jgi:hypothetical protein